MICQKVECHNYRMYHMIHNGFTVATTGNYKLPCSECLHSIVDVEKLTKMFSKFVDKINFKEAT